MRSTPAGVRQIGSIGKPVAPVVRVDHTPIGFEIDDATQNYMDLRGAGAGGGGLSGIGDKMTPVGGSHGEPDDGDHHDGGHGGHGDHDDGHHGGHGDSHDDHDGHDGHDGHGGHGGHGGGHHDHHHYYYTHSSCPSGWWYLYGDYNGDGFTDYVCTNGSRSIYWYGWSGSYWGASPWYGWYGASYHSSYSWWWYSTPDRYRGTVYGTDAGLTSDPSYSSEPVEALPDAVPLSALEVARLEMSIGEPGVAIDAYRSHLGEYPSDWTAVRELGVAMILSGQRGDGIAMVSYAYMMDPDLAYEALPVSVFEQSDHVLRDAVIDVVGWGHRNPSSSVWLTAASLMQAEGRDGPALRMIERAQGYGLDQEVSTTMRAALTHQ